MGISGRFLTAPDLFPGRRSGEAWGASRLRLDLPGGPYGAAGLSAHQAEAARSRFGEACQPEGTGPAPAPDLLVFRAPATDFRDVDTRGWSYDLDFDHGPRAVGLAGLRWMGRLDWPEGEETAPVAALWTSEEGDLFPGIFENLLRVLVAYRLVAAGGALLHAAGVADERGAFLFLGASGAGKSTLSRLAHAAGKRVLSDDLNAVLPGEDGGARVERVPFTGDFAAAGAPGTYRLRGLLRLEKAAENTLSPLGAAGLLATLLACAPFVNADPLRRDRLAANLEGLARRTPRGGLAFSLAGGFWRILEEAFP